MGAGLTANEDGEVDAQLLDLIIREKGHLRCARARVSMPSIPLFPGLPWSSAPEQQGNQRASADERKDWPQQSHNLCTSESEESGWRTHLDLRKVFVVLGVSEPVHTVPRSPRQMQAWACKLKLPNAARRHTQGDGSICNDQPPASHAGGGGGHQWEDTQKFAAIALSLLARAEIQYL
eukprot:3714980-Rhodomonas_salina.2